MIAYLDSHHDNESVLNDLVVSHRLCLIVHDLSIGNQLLCFGGLSVRGLNKFFESSNLDRQYKRKVMHPGQPLSQQLLSEETCRIYI